MPSSEEGSPKDWKYAREILRRIMREWFPHLSALERLAVLFVYDRTYGWGKEWERITGEQFARGVWGTGDDGEPICYAAPFTRSPSRAREVVNALVDRGVLLRRDAPPVPKSKKYAINPAWDPSMRVPKRQLDTTGKGRITRPEKGESVRPEKVDKEEVKGEEENPDGKTGRTLARPSSVADRKMEIERRTVAVRARSRAKTVEAEQKGRKLRKDGTGFHPTQAALPLIWKRLWKTNYPDSAVTPVPELLLTILWNYWRRWVEARDSGEFVEYLSWLFENWNAIRVGSLGWMTDCPKTPDMRMIVSAKLRGFFEQAYREKEALAVWRKLEPHEREVQRLVSEGMDAEKATEIVERRYATSSEVRRLKDAEARMRLQAEILAKQEAARAKTEAVRTRTKPLDPKGWDSRKK